MIAAWQMGDVLPITDTYFRLQGIKLEPPFDKLKGRPDELKGRLRQMAMALFARRVAHLASVDRKISASASIHGRLAGQFPSH